MAKADELKKKLGANIAESGRKAPVSESGAAVATIPPRREPTGERKGARRHEDAMVIEVGRIIPDPDQPRKEFDARAIERMGKSLVRHGQIMPIRVRWSASDDRYILIAGERRYRGAIKAELPTLVAIVEKGLVEPGKRMAMQLVENLVREDLSPMDQARAYKRLMTENKWSGKRLAEELDIAQPRVVQALALLELPEAIAARVDDEDLSPTTAYELSKVADPVVQEAIAAQAVDQGLKRDEVREKVREATGGGKARNPGKGRGAKAKAGPRKLTSRLFNHDGLKIEVKRGKGFELAELPEALEAVARNVRSELAEVA